MCQILIVLLVGSFFWIFCFFFSDSYWVTPVIPNHLKKKKETSARLCTNFDLKKGKKWKKIKKAHTKLLPRKFPNPARGFARGEAWHLKWRGREGFCTALRRRCWRKELDQLGRKGQPFPSQSRVAPLLSSSVSISSRSSSPQGAHFFSLWRSRFSKDRVFY